MKAAILETVQKKQLILFLSYFSRLLKRKARQFGFFHWPFNFCPHSLHYVSRRENHLGHSCSLLRVRAGGAAGAFPYGIHYRVAYLIFYYNFFGLSIWKRILLQFPVDPGIQPRSRKKIISWYLPHHSHLQLYCGCHRLIHSTKKSFLETRFL